MTGYLLQNNLIEKLGSLHNSSQTYEDAIAALMKIADGEMFKDSTFE